MKIVNKQLKQTADVSSGRGSTFQEFWKMVLAAVLLLVGLFFVTGFVVDGVVSGISFETEAKLFTKARFGERFASEESPPTAFARAQAILKKLQANPSVPALPYQLLLMDKDLPNAFAFPGGTIGLTSGLLEALDDEIEMAFVIGHEIGHFKNRDHLEGLGRAIGFGICMQMVFGGTGGAESFGDIAAFVLQRGYSQQRETDADRFGIELVYHAYEQTRGVDRLFKILQQKQDLPQWAYMFSTHPAPQKRIRELNAYALSLSAAKGR